jgi:hypothetical protein
MQKRAGVFRRMAAFMFIIVLAGNLSAQDLSGIQLHGFVTQGFMFSTHNNYLTMQTSSGSLQWTDGVFNVSDSLGDNLRVGVQFHMFQLGQLGGPNVHVDWASGLSDQRLFWISRGKSEDGYGIVQRFP